MRIGVVTTSYPRTDGEAAGSFVAAHVAALRACGHDVDVISSHTIDPHGSSGLFFGAGAPDELERNRVRSYVAAARFTAQLTATVARRARNWDLIIAHWLAPSALAALPTRTPLLAIAHGGDVHTLRRLRLLSPVLHLLRARGARLAFVSDELRAVARAAAPRAAPYIDRALVQPMGIDVARFGALGHVADAEATIANEVATNDGALPMILVVARLVPIKGVDVAIDAHRLLRTPARLVVAGDGPERQALEAQTGSSATTSSMPRADPQRRAFFLGAVDAVQRDQLLCSAAVVVIPSRVLPSGRTEGTPMIALEALAAGLPVVASAVGGLRELPGITRVQPDDPQALAVGIDRVLASPPARVDVTHFDWSRVSARLLDHASAR